MVLGHSKNLKTIQNQSQPKTKEHVILQQQQQLTGIGEMYNAWRDKELEARCEPVQPFD